MPPAKLSTACGYPNRTKAEVLESKRYRERKKKEKVDEGGERERKIEAGEDMPPPSPGTMTLSSSYPSFPLLPS